MIQAVVGGVAILLSCFSLAVTVRFSIGVERMDERNRQLIGVSTSLAFPAMCTALMVLVVLFRRLHLSYHFFIYAVEGIVITLTALQAYLFLLMRKNS